MSKNLKLCAVALLAGCSQVLSRHVPDNLWDGTEAVSSADAEQEMLPSDEKKTPLAMRASERKNKLRKVTPNAPATMDKLEVSGLTDEKLPAKKLVLTGKHVQILGLFDTGTNLLRALIEANFPGQVHIYDMYNPPMTFWRTRDEPDCLVDSPQGTRICSLWKHANLDVIKKLAPRRLDDFAANNVTAIAMIRDPMSWLQSIRKEGYDFARNGNDPSKDTWLTDEVKATPSWYGGEKVVYESLSEIWNNQTASYSHLKQYGFSNSMVIRYEDLVLNTQAVMNRVVQLLGLRAPETFDQIEDSAKSGNSTGHDEAVEKIRQRSYLTLFSSEDFATACNKSNSSLAKRFNYTDCVSPEL